MNTGDIDGNHPFVPDDRRIVVDRIRGSSRILDILFLRTDDELILIELTAHYPG